ncbi:polymerase delta-interacting protein 3-like [Bradysia coprophila]|uniref:polymerase delta-interacting protein 3-like n=1 Tax=Bradysia coprophila TaxID=38358 RepID=UPI00187DB60E|nr:polymerase delta-interacting protein 3-like [Bradysia coprophila]
MQEIGMSLDEIIQKKKTNGPRKGNERFPKSNRRPQPNNSKGAPSAGRFNAGKPVVDARNKIIQKNRSKIRDARDKLVQIAKRSGDARLKLMKKQENHRVPLHLTTRKQRRQPMIPDRKPAYRQHDDLMDIEDDFIPAPLALRRTVKNEIAMMPPLPTFKVDRRPPSNPWNSDPFDCYEVPTERPVDVSEPRHLQRTIRNPELDMMPRKGILRSSRPLSPPPSHSHGHGHGSYIPDENSHLSYKMRTRLKTLPDSNVSMGMFSNPYTKPLSPPKNSGYRIVVSNLHSSVSQSDIKELFEDIGTLMEARLVRPGVAEVIYTSMKDAETAVDTYHNRQLDGQPMKCLLVNPRSIQNKPTAPAIKRSSYYGSPNSTTNKSFEVDIDALHSVLFRRH